MVEKAKPVGAAVAAGAKALDKLVFGAPKKRKAAPKKAAPKKTAPAKKAAPKKTPAKKAAPKKAAPKKRRSSRKSSGSIGDVSIPKW